jgi:predicted ribosome quality control (RQC) complex YloA/Tae2 family protein
MNNFYVLIYQTKHLENKCTGGTFVFSYSPHKNVWECYIKLKSETIRIILSTNPGETALFTDNDRAPKKANVTSFFNSLEKDVINTVSLAENDRFITINFTSGKSLLFQLFGNNPNVFLTESGVILEAFKSNSELAGSRAPEPRAANRNTDEPKESASAKKIITATNPKFPRHLIDSVTEFYSLNEKPADDIRSTIQTLTEAMIQSPEFRVLEDGNLCLIPGSLLPLNNRKLFDNSNDAVRFAYYDTSRERRLTSRIQTLKPKIAQAVQRNESVMKQLENADKGIERSEQYEQFGHILMAHAHQSTDHYNQEVTLPNFYDDNEPVSIPIKPSLSIADNAERYYDKSTKAKRNVEESKRRLKEIKEVNRDLKTLQDSFNKIEKIYEFDDWYKENEQELRRLGILAKSQQTESLPYRRGEIDNYEIWIGKNAKSNDRLTTDAHKEDIWLHARGVSGSHVVIRMNNSQEMPPRHILLKAAAIAAWNSKARGSKLAPVIVAKRKHITKPKGAVPGAVRVQREQVEMVQPQKYPK